MLVFTEPHRHRTRRVVERDESCDQLAERADRWSSSGSASCAGCSTPSGSTSWTEVRAGVVLARAVHRPNSHREHICANLTALGIEPPTLKHSSATPRYAAPFGVLNQYVEDDEDTEEDGGAEPTSGISVLQRRDYQVTDEAAVMAGRAYLRIWPQNGEAAAAADVSHLGRALYQMAHAHGWHSLDAVDGLRPTGGYVAVVRQDGLLGPDPDRWPADLFDGGTERLYQQRDVFGG
jgi:hypothetical protein